MKFTNPFSSRRPTEQLDVPVLTFVGEQDGPPERMLKGKLSGLFATLSGAATAPKINARGVSSRFFEGRTNVLRAYLARAHYGDPQAASVLLCLGVTSGADERLVEAIHSLFALHFNRAVHLDILFLNPKQEEQLAMVCKPFYQSE